MHGAFSANLDAVCESIISSFLHKHYRPLSPNMKQLHIKNFQVSITSAYSTACASYISLRSPLAGGQRALSATAEPAPGDLDDDLQPHLLVTFIKFDPYGSYTVEPLLLRFHAHRRTEEGRPAVATVAPPRGGRRRATAVAAVPPSAQSLASCMPPRGSRRRAYGVSTVAAARVLSEPGH